MFGNKKIVEALKVVEEKLDNLKPIKPIDYTRQFNGINKKLHELIEKETNVTINKTVNEIKGEDLVTTLKELVRLTKIISSSH